MCQYLRQLRNGRAVAKNGTFDVFSVNLLKNVIVLHIWFYISIFAFDINNNLKQNNMNELKITIPEGFEIDKENSTFELIKFKKIENKLPKKWEELNKISGAFISNRKSKIECVNCFYIDDTTVGNKQIFPTKEYAEAALALAQLLQLRQVYNNGWEPDWTNNESKFCIYPSKNKIQRFINTDSARIMSFETMEIRDLFLENFRELLEIAKPLL